MEKGKGCTFCRRYGLPVLPVRPAIMEKGSPLPLVPDTITLPVPAEGGADYTLRLMRQGFLYIWVERLGEWLNYYATGDGYFYPLLRDGEVPPRVASGEMKPCITQPSELATASLVTLPMMPAGMTNGLFWFAWSEEHWTPAVRQQHEDAAWRSRYMQAFDMDAWLIRHSGQQALPFPQLSDCVAEYNPGLARSRLKDWTPYPLKETDFQSSTYLEQAAETLSPGKGAILVLEDPTGIATEISALTRYRMQQALSTNSALKRGLALDTMLNSVELAMRNHFYLSAEEADQRYELKMRYGWDGPAGPHFPAPEIADRQHDVAEASRADRVDEAWQTGYEKYIDRAQQQAFSQTLKAWLTEYDQSSVVPLTRMYLAWLQGPAMTDYFVQHFDPACAHSGGRYIQAVAKVLAGMNDKGGVITHIEQQLNHAPLTPENFLLRAAFFNHDAWIAQADAQLQTGGPDWWLGMSWDRLADGAKEYSGNYAGAILTGLEKLSLLWSGAMMKSVDLMVKGTPVRFAIGILAMQGKAFSAVSVQPGTKNFVGAMTRGIAGLLEMSGKTGGQLYNAMRKLAARLEKELPKNARGQIQLPRIINVQEAMNLKALPVKERLAKLNTAMLSDDDLARMLFPKSLNSSVAQLEGMSPTSLAREMSAKGLTFGGTVFSAYFQWMVLSYGLKESGLPTGGKAATVFGANASMAVASTAEALKLAMTPLMQLELSSTMSLVRNGAMKVVGAGFWGGLGYGGGVVYTAVEFWNGLSDALDGKVGVGLGHLINSVGIGMMTVGGGSRITITLISLLGVSKATLAGSELAAFFLGPAGIFVGMLLVLGAGAWLLSHTRNEIQKWLLRTQWRRIPEGEDDIPFIYPNDRMEKDGYMALNAQGATHV
ncbi:T6SS effector BTH_I2691 family protein [Scandinavium sp. NPDC088450]|uniref:T6SS effector BTH_I2691 family protein n=1 Tax=Scandinavium sp. NPDC088450 TaxID=3364514 RepID=UPI0038506D15